MAELDLTQLVHGNPVALLLHLTQLVRGNSIETDIQKDGLTDEHCSNLYLEER
jgi:hypothetical protein